MPSVDIPSDAPSERYRRMSALAEAADVEDVDAPHSEDGTEYLYVKEFDATYRWDADCEDDADGFGVLAPAEDAAGRWLLVGSEIRLAPRGADLDDWPRLRAAIAALAYRGRVRCAAGAWRCDSNQSLAISGGRVTWEAGSTLAMTLTALGIGGGFAASAFYNTSGTESGDATTVASDAAAGVLEVTVASVASLHADDWIQIYRAGGIGGHRYLCTRQIRKIVGLVLTLDRPLFRPYPAGCGVHVVTPTRDFEVEGNGLVVTGTGDAIWQVNAAVNCKLKGIRGSGTFGIYLYCADVGSRDMTFEDVDGDGLDVTNVVFQIDYGEMVRHINCNGRRGKVTDMAHNSSDFCELQRGSLTEQTQAGGNRAVWVVSALDSSDDIGCQGIRAVGTVIAGGIGPGLLAQNGAQVALVDVDISGCQTGIVATAGTAASEVTTFGGRIHDNSQYALIAQQASSIRTYGTVRSGSKLEATGGTVEEN